MHDLWVGIMGFLCLDFDVSAGGWLLVLCGGGGGGGGDDLAILLSTTGTSNVPDYLLYLWMILLLLSVIHK